MPYFLAIRQRIVIETILIDAASEDEARKSLTEGNLNQGRLYHVENGDVVDGSMTITPFTGLDCGEGEQVFEVSVTETSGSVTLVSATDREHAIVQVREGAGFGLHERDFFEVSDSSDWVVRTPDGNIVD